MAKGGPAVAAAVDVGSNSVHLLVAARSGQDLRPLADESELLGLGDRIDSDGYLGRAGRAEVAAVLRGYAETARRLGATTITFAGTEPVRRAADAASIVSEVAMVTGIPLHVLDHHEEAYLTLLGVTSGRRSSGELVVVDVGGGSSQLVAVGPSRPARAVGLRLGSAALTGRHATHDPPLREEIDRMLVEARQLVRHVPEAEPDDLVAVGGTASNLVRVVPAAAAGRALTRAGIEQALEILLGEPAAAASARHGINMVRARILPAGAAILAAVLERYGMERLRVSDASIREGLVLATLRDPIGWRDRLPESIGGWTG